MWGAGGGDRGHCHRGERDRRRGEPTAREATKCADRTGVALFPAWEVASAPARWPPSLTRVIRRGIGPGLIYQYATQQPRVAWVAMVWLATVWTLWLSSNKLKTLVHTKFSTKFSILVLNLVCTAVLEYQRGYTY